MITSGKKQNYGWVKKILMVLFLTAGPVIIAPSLMHAQQLTESQKKLKKTKKMRMKESKRAENEGLKRHLSIQTKDTRKRMKKHKKQTKKHIQTHQHRRE